MICKKVKQLLSELEFNPGSVPVLVCSSTAALVLLPWAVKELMKRKFVQAKHCVETLEEVVQQLRREVVSRGSDFSRVVYLVTPLFLPL